MKLVEITVLSDLTGKSAGDFTLLFTKFSSLQRSYKFHEQRPFSNGRLVLSKFSPDCIYEFRHRKLHP